MCTLSRPMLPISLLLDIALAVCARFPGPTPFTIPNCSSIGSAVFARPIPHPYTWHCTAPPAPPKNLSYHGEIWTPHLKHGSLVPPDLKPQTACRSTTHTHEETDGQTDNSTSASRPRPMLPISLLLDIALAVCAQFTDVPTHNRQTDKQGQI